MKVNGSIDSGGICGLWLQFMAPRNCQGCHFHLQCDSMVHALLWGPPNDPAGVLAAGGCLAGSLMTPSL